MSSQTISTMRALVAPHLEASDQVDALEQLADMLYEQGCVTASYKEAVQLREQQFPTALAYPHVGVALPHTDAVHTRQAAVLCARCTPPVMMHAMDDATQLVPVELICMLAIDDPSQHLEVLARLLAGMGDPTVCTKLLNATHEQEFLAQLQSLLAG